MWYDLCLQPLNWLLGRWRCALVAPLSGAVLELAIGTGANLPCYARSACVTGIDRDLAMLRQARRRVRACDLTTLWRRWRFVRSRIPK